MHAQRARTGDTDWHAIVLLYDALLRIAPAIGARVARAAALANAHGPSAGLSAIDAIAVESIASYQPYWALRAHLLTQLGRHDQARDARTRAIGLSEDSAVREFLARTRAK
ncbi:MAG TPA: hypothetical protein VKD69_20240 [Vicinamibacterales bacterium]|nr:hypothetical protein [Vicinamibacterales bacterium]